MTRSVLIALFAVMFAPGLASSQVESQVHRIDVKSPDGLRDLLHYDGATMPLVSAHRGGALPGYPENCIETFEHTLRHAFSFLEIDLQYTKDGQIVLHHDATLERTTTGAGRVADRTLQELRELRLKDKDGNVTEYRMPTLDEALQWARGRTIVILDKKDVPVEVCVKKIQEHRAQAYAMVMAYSFQDIQTCHNLDPDIMMEVMIGDHQRFRGFDETGVPWDRVVAFVGHEPPEDKQLLEKIHARGACCMAGTSRNLDRQLRVAAEGDRNALEREYRSRLDSGVDLIETDLPIQVGNLLYDPPKIPAAKCSYFDLPNESQCSRMEMAPVADSGKAFTLDRSGQRFTPWGFNYVGDFGRIVEEYWEDDWPRVVKDFPEMRSLGANVVRLHLQVGTYMTSPDQVDQEELKRLRRILDLAEDMRLYLDLTGLGCYHLDHGFGSRTHRTLAFGQSAGGWRDCCLPMPFREKATISLTSRSADAVECDMQLLVEQDAALPADVLYLRSEKNEGGSQDFEEVNVKLFWNDPMTFRKAIRFNWEWAFRFGVKPPRDAHFASVVYWYAKP